MRKNMNNESFTVAGRLRSIGYAVSGIKEVFKGQHNAWVHFLAASLVICAALYFSVTQIEWCLLITAITSVLVAESLNTALEYLCDVASPDFHPLVKKSKDIAAGAVLISAIGSAVIGVVIFYPYVI